jgi:hypothetical protein
MISTIIRERPSGYDTIEKLEDSISSPTNDSS